MPNASPLPRFKGPTHKLRLAITAAAVSAAVILATFWVLFQFAKEAAISEKQEELRNAIALLTSDPTEEPDFADVRVLNPPVSVLYFREDGTKDDAMGPPLPAALPLDQIEASKKPVLLEGAQTLVTAVRDHGRLLIVGTSWRDSARSLGRLGLILSLLWLPLSLLVGIGSWIAANGIFRPLSRLSLEADAIGGADLSQRLSTTDSAEFAQFAERLNRMLDRIERTALREDRFAADAAHELRTPLAIMRTRIETTLLRRRDDAEHEEALRQLLVEVDRLSIVVSALLRTARSRVERAKSIELSDALAPVVERWQPRLEAEGLMLEASLNPVQAEILPEELEIITDNLIDNARRFAPPKTAIKLELTEGGVLSVEDSGPGLEEKLLESAFDRFVRGESSRNREFGGLGIGLTLVRRIAESRGASVSVENVPGAKFSIQFPR